MAAEGTVTLAMRRLGKRDLFRYFYRDRTESYFAFEAAIDCKVSAARYLATRIRQHARTGSVRLAEVGAGSGDVLLPLIRTLSRYGVRTRALAIEPSPVLASELACRAESMGLTKGVLVHRVPFGTDYRRPRGFPKVDIVVASFVFFWFPDWESTLRRIGGLLVPGGRAYFVHLSKASPAAHLRQELYHLAHGRGMETGEDIERTAEGLGWAVTGKSVPYCVRIPDREDQRKAVIEFMIRYPWEELAPETRSLIDARLSGRRTVRCAQRISEVVPCRIGR